MKNPSKLLIEKVNEVYGRQRREREKLNFVPSLHIIRSGERGRESELKIGITFSEVI